MFLYSTDYLRTIIKYQTVQQNHQKPFVPLEIRLSKGPHLPQATTMRRCAHCLIQKRTHWMCSVCKVPLCHLNKRDCFKLYHLC